MLFRILLILTVMAGSPSSPRSVLFIGNSLTYGNDVPSMVKRMAALSGHRIRSGMVAFPNFSLRDHLDDGRAAREIRRKHFDLVILQQGPSAMEASRVDLRAAVRDLDLIITGAGGRSAVVGVWPWSSRPMDFQRAAESARLAAADVGGMYLPVAEAWKVVLESEGRRVGLYAADGLHASPAGSYLSALVIHRTVFGTLSPRFASPQVADEMSGAPLRLSAKELQTLVDAAESVCRGAAARQSARQAPLHFAIPAGR